MNTTPYDPYRWNQPRTGPSALKLLLATSILATLGMLVGIFALPAGHIEEERLSMSTGAVSHLSYSASLVREIDQPAGDIWTMPAAAVAVDGFAFVVDTGNDRILKLDGTGHVVAVFDSASSAGLTLDDPMATATDGERLFVASSLAAEVVVLDLSGAVQAVVPLRPTAGGLTPRPIGIAVTPGGGMIVSDANNHQVLALDSEGALQWSFGAGVRAAGSSGFNVPGALALDSAGNVYVVDTLNGRVVKLSPGGAMTEEFGRLGDTAGTLSRPKGVAVDGEGRVYVSDGLQAAVQVFSPDGEYLGFIGRRDQDDPASTSLFKAPAGLFLAEDTLYVTDRLAGLITLRLPDSPLPTGAGDEAAIP